MFDRLVWLEDRVLLDDLVFRLEHCRNEDWELGDECFVLYKTKSLVNQYARFWGLRRGFDVQNLLELGIWDGGSIVLWYEYFQPQKCVGIDIQERQDSSYFWQYVYRKGLQGTIEMYWGTDQADSQRLRQIVRTEFTGRLDLVIDDASHMYEPTKTSFETLFPLLRPGGLYVVEDWAWGHWKEFQAADHPWAKETPLTKLMVELVKAVGTGRGLSGSAPLVAGLSLSQGFGVIERGEDAPAEVADFKLEDFIAERSESRVPEPQGSRAPPTAQGVIKLQADTNKASGGRQ